MHKNHKIGGFSHFLIFLQTNQKLAGSALRPFGASASSAPTSAPGRGVGGLTACSCSPSDPPPLACSVLGFGQAARRLRAGRWRWPLAHWRRGADVPTPGPWDADARAASGPRPPVPCPRGRDPAETVLARS